MKKHNSTQNVTHSSYNNIIKEGSLDLWDLNEPSNFIKKQKNTKSSHFEKFVNHKQVTQTKYKPQLSLPSSNSMNSKSQKDPRAKRTKSVEKSSSSSYKISSSASSLPKKINPKPKKQNVSINVSISDYKNPDKVVKYIKNKCNEKSNGNKSSSNSQKIIEKKPNTKIEEIANNLYSKKTLSIDYELQRKIKQMKDEEQMKQELSECTFKPKLYTSNRNTNCKKINEENKKNIYEQQNKWLNAVNEKKEKNLEKQVDKELEKCSFNPKTTKMPNFNTSNYVNKNFVEKGLYYSKIKNAKRQSTEKLKRNNEKDFAKCYDERKKKEMIGNYNNNMNIINNNNLINNVNQKSQNVQNLKSNTPSEKQIEVVDDDFESKKEQLMKELHNWKSEDENNSEEQDDFFS